VPRHNRFSNARMTPAGRRREIVAILSHGLCRMHARTGPGSEESLHSGPEPACFPGKKAAHCVSNAASLGVSEAENDEDAR
jgi:hypothetical protein